MAALGRGMGRSAWFAFALVYLTFFLDNVLLTVLVPIIPDWVAGDSLALWRSQRAPLATLLNHTLTDVMLEDGVGGSQAAVGAVLGAKAGAQLLCAPLAAAAVAARGPAPVLRAATALMGSAALLFALCSSAGWRAGGALCCGAGRAAQGAAAAAAAVAGLALVAAAVPRDCRERAVAGLLGAVAFGVLVGYPFGGLAGEAWSAPTPFLVLTVAFIANYVMQLMLLDKEEFSQPLTPVPSNLWSGWSATRAQLRDPRVAWCCTAVALTTSVMAALEPCLPLWITQKFHPQHWWLGFVFVPDSAGYAVATMAAGARNWGSKDSSGTSGVVSPESVALAGQAALGLAALAIPHVKSVTMLALPHVALGAGVGSVDAALLPALLAAAPRSALPARAAAAHQAAAAAYALGPVVGGFVSWAFGFDTLVRALGVANLVHCALLSRALAANPLSAQWGATFSDDSDDEETAGSGGGGGEVNELKPLRCDNVPTHTYTQPSQK